MEEKMEEGGKRRNKVRREEEKASFGPATIAQDKEDQMWEDSNLL